MDIVYILAYHILHKELDVFYFRNDLLSFLVLCDSVALLHEEVFAATEEEDDIEFWVLLSNGDFHDSDELHKPCEDEGSIGQEDHN